jgi:3-phenylpropionate/trans-cinnamate dioxygenase ferredoxin subunit
VRQRLLGRDELASGEARRVVIDGRRIAVVRIDDDFYALDDTCSHADVSLSEGEVLCADREIECWKHGSTFSLLTGEPTCLPAVRPVAVYPVTVEGDDVLIDVPTDVLTDVLTDVEVDR